MTRERGLGSPFSHRVSYGLSDLKRGSLGERGLGHKLLLLEQGLTMIKFLEGKELVAHRNI